ncbi:hypothetical protein [Mycetocola reblochoni]|uniref:hypothetical protein n=1 Tax=Mycetocola reblochoni TaxID=331618 RepID=UPI003F989095
MNRYAACSLAAAACFDDRRILVVSDRARVALSEFAPFSEGATVRRANGAGRIDFPGGGTIRVISPGSRGGRGLAVHTVFLDEGVERTHPNLATDLAPCVAGFPDGEMIRA